MSQVKKIKAAKSTKPTGVLPYAPRHGMGTPPGRKVMHKVNSLQIRSDTQPKSGRPTPFIRLLRDSEKVSAGITQPIRVSGFCAIPKELAIGASCAVTISPVAATRRNATYMSQKIGDRSVCSGELSI